ncbi:OPT oligopeptide transporter protein-domain-containing protein [Lipomyces japonicus]|uniref:OPT oligopeptide transporter protein-domain-containing protein n=1 Tax=Lipomyces japonicus TaxID=56871 RepID=UPI0034CECD23
MSSELPGVSCDFKLVQDKIQALSLQGAIEILSSAIEYHRDDCNFPVSTMDKIKFLVQQADKSQKLTANVEYELKVEAAIIKFYSPYPEVRSIIDISDNSDCECETIRVYILAIIWTIIGAGVQQFFSPRQPSISLPSTVIQLFLYPCGRVLELLPKWEFFVFSKRYSLNPGPWSFKEQMLCTIMINVAIGGAYVALYQIMVEKLDMFYGNKWATTGYQVLLIYSTQFMGFGFAGILRRWVIYPIKAVWPTVLPSIALSQALLKPEPPKIVHGWKISRYWFFVVVCTISFVYFWFPNYIFEALCKFNWMTWISPDNLKLAIITGSTLGLGLNPFSTFDFNVAVRSNPLVTPFYSLVNQYCGSLISAFIILLMYFTNYKWTAYLPINTNTLRTNRNETFQVSQILTNGLLDEKKYQNYSPPYYSAGDLMQYGAMFALYPLTIIWIFCTEGQSISSTLKEIWHDIRNHQKGSIYGKFDDHFSKAAFRFGEVSHWWFLTVMAISFVLAILCLTLYPTETPVWGLVLIILVNAAFLIPITLTHAVSGWGFGLNVLCELISGYIFPGNGSALMILKAFGYNIDGQAESYISDQKIAHYAKIPPRAVFRGQMLTTFLQCFMSIAVVNWQIDNIDNLCDPRQSQRFTCPGPRTYYSASVTWGVIGPKRMFQGLYPTLQWCFLIGAVTTIPFIILRKYFPTKMRYVNPILIVGGMSSWAPYNLSYQTPALYLSVMFMYYVKSRYLAWWEKYNYVLSSAMNAGIAFSAIIIFFAVQYRVKYLPWWGNTVINSGIDGGNGRQVLLDLPEIGYFGPAPGNYP